MTPIAQFYAKNVYVLEEDAHFVDHEGKPYINEDFPKGSVIAEAENGILLYNKEPFDTETWPPRNSKGLISLWRDYWSVVGGQIAYLQAPDAKHISPYVNAVLNAKRRCVTPQKVKKSKTAA